MERITQLENEVKALRKLVESLSNYSTIPIDYGNALRARIASGSVEASFNASAPATVTINESGSAIVIAAAPFTGRLQLTTPDGVTYVVPTI